MLEHLKRLLMFDQRVMVASDLQRIDMRRSGLREPRRPKRDGAIAGASQRQLIGSGNSRSNAAASGKSRRLILADGRRGVQERKRFSS